MPPLESDEEMHQDLEDEPMLSTEAPPRKIFGPTSRGRSIAGRGEPMDSGDGPQPGFSGTGMGKETENKPVRRVRGGRNGTGGRGKGRGNKTLN